MEAFQSLVTCQLVEFLTYEDVTNIDSVGIVTAREGIFIPDNKELKIGNTAASADLRIHSNGTESFNLILMVVIFILELPIKLVELKIN